MKRLKGRWAFRLARHLLPWFRLCGGLSRPCRLSATFSKAFKWRWREIVNFLWTDIWESLKFHPTKSNMKSQFLPELFQLWFHCCFLSAPRTCVRKLSFGVWLLVGTSSYPTSIYAFSLDLSMHLESREIQFESITEQCQLKDESKKVSNYRLAIYFEVLIKVSLTSITYGCMNLFVVR